MQFRHDGTVDILGKTDTVPRHADTYYNER